MNKTKKTNKTSMWQRRLGRQQRHREGRLFDTSNDRDSDSYNYTSTIKEEEETEADGEETNTITNTREMK